MADEQITLPSLSVPLRALPRSAVLSLEEVAGYWRTSSQTIRRLLSDGELEAFSVRGQWRIKRTEVLRFQRVNTFADCPIPWPKHVPPMEMERLPPWEVITLPELCGYWRVSQRTLWRLLEEGGLKAWVLAATIRFNRGNIRRYEDRQAYRQLKLSDEAW